MDFGQYIEELINEVKGLFGARKRFVSPSHPSPYGAPKKLTIEPKGYTAPIHGIWRSSGGFTYAPNPTHPKGHMGVDMRAGGGTAVYPIAPGIVTNVGTDPLGGNIVNVAHTNNVKSYYAHMSVIKVQKGDRVDTNTVLGNIGASGSAKNTWPHLHLQVWVNGQITDPANLFSVPPYTDPSPEERQRGMWLSEQAKQNAQDFNMQEHLAKRRVAFSQDTEKLLKTASAYCDLTKTLSV